MKKLLLALIAFYRRFLSPLTGNACRFYPTCSAYTAEAITRHGALKGTILGVWRLMRCHPWTGSNPIDPVPKTFTLCGCRPNVKKGDPERGPV